MSKNEYIAEESGIRFEFVENADIGVFDTYAREQELLTFGQETEFRRFSSNRFHYPVDCAITVDTDTVTVHDGLPVFVRSENGEFVTSVSNSRVERFDTGAYLLEFGSRVKLYMTLNGPFEVDLQPQSTRVSLATRTDVHIGARSRHEQPAQRIITTDDPATLMEAVSVFGAALKTTSPERSFPTLRGHPPALELGDEPNFPDNVSTPHTGITIEIPSNLSSVLSVTPLAYYLGATVDPGSNPRITTANGWSHSLPEEHFQTAIQRILKQIFFLDCVIRTVGLYPVELRERTTLEQRIDFDLGDLYSQSPGERLRSYLQCDFETIADLIPSWPAHANVEERPSSIEYLPYLAYNLTTISTFKEPNSGKSTSNNSTVSTGIADTTAESSNEDAGEVTSTEFPEVIGEVDEFLWIGDGFPSGYTKALLSGYEHRLQVHANEANIRVAVVLNDDVLTDEVDKVKEIYGEGSSFLFDVSIHRNLDRESFESLLGEDIDFLHYVGHVTEDGFQCTDGSVDISPDTEVGVTYFLLNACSTYTQGCKLVKSGSTGGIVTLSNVTDSSAGWLGVAIAKLLNAGYPMQAALSVLRPSSLISESYQVVGNGVAAVSSRDQLPHMIEIRSVTEPIKIDHTTFHSARTGLGGISSPFLGDNDVYTIVPTTVTWNTDLNELLEFCELGWFPVRIDGELFWSDEVDEQVLDGRLQPAD